MLPFVDLSSDQSLGLLLRRAGGRNHPRTRRALPAFESCRARQPSEWRQRARTRADTIGAARDVGAAGQCPDDRRSGLCHRPAHRRGHAVCSSGPSVSSGTCPISSASRRTLPALSAASWVPADAEKKPASALKPGRRRIGCLHALSERPVLLEPADRGGAAEERGLFSRRD